MKILHENDFRNSNHSEYMDEPYFRLYHSLEKIDAIALDGISIVTAKQDDIPLFVEVINQSYTDLSVTIEQLNMYTQTAVYSPDLWVMAVDKTTDTIVGCGIADFDRELGEGIIEWVQVIPAYRGNQIGQLIVSELLGRMKSIAKFVTVSGKIDNITNPERLYRKCGFVGNDVWHILTKRK